jgi:hypothetical protein
MANLDGLWRSNATIKRPPMLWENVPCHHPPDVHTASVKRSRCPTRCKVDHIRKYLCNGRVLMTWNTRSLGDPKRKVWCSSAASFPSERNQGYRTSRSSNSSEGCWWLARRNTITNVESAHNTIKLLCPNETVRLSISPACWKQRIKRMVWKMSIKLQRMKKEQFAVCGCLISVKEWTGVHSSLVVSLHKR